MRRRRTRARRNRRRVNRRPSHRRVYPPPFGGGGRIGQVGPVAVTPAATLACPIVSALDQWIATAVQPAALHWFRQPVVEIKQISAYSCRGMNGNPNAHISEHAFGNALDIAEFDLADGHRDQRAIWLARHAGRAGLSARRAGGGLRAVHHRAGAGRQRLSLQSHSRRSDAPRERPPHLRARRPSPAKSSPRAPAPTTPRSTRAIPASPARSNRRSGISWATAARTTIACRSPSRVTISACILRRRRFVRIVAMLGILAGYLAVAFCSNTAALRRAFRPVRYRQNR